MPNTNKKTKIVATIGPASDSVASIKQLIQSGVNVFRFNMKHGEIEWHHQTMDKVQSVADKLNVSVGILIDLQGPEIRIHTKDQQTIKVNKGQEVTFANKFTKDTQICIPHDSVFKALSKGDKFVLDDGFVSMVVTKKRGKSFVAKTMENSQIKHMRSMNLFGVDIKLPSLIDDDIDRLNIASIKKVDYVALSFTRSKKDIFTLQKEMAKKNVNAKIVAKVESQKAIDNIDEIIKYSDVVMIARGDLGVETPIEKLAYYQKMIINKCRIASTPVIVATQMLESMIVNPFPTRAEATDVANAVLDGSDALMLSGETALGKYPIKAVQEMAKIVQFNENQSANIKFDIRPLNATELIINAAETIAEHADKYKIDHIVVFTETGYTAKVLSSYRPSIPVIAVSNSEKTLETLTMSYGVLPVKVKFATGRLLSPEGVLTQLKEKKKLKSKDVVLLVHGQHWQKPGQTNAILLVTVE